MKRTVRILGCFLIFAGAPARADDWVVARHDPQRTGRSSGRPALASPGLRWRHYLGGSLRADQLVVTDIDGDRTTDVVYVAGGRVICKHADDTLVWESPLLELTSLVGVTDLDRDQRAEVVAVGVRGAVVVIAGRDGTLLWEVPPAVRGAGGSARVADLDGDGRDDLYVGECLNAPAHALAYGFTGGFGAARELWRLAASDTLPCGTGADLVGDLDGDGRNEVVMGNHYDRLRVLDGRTGSVRADVLPPPSSPFANNFTLGMLRNLDDDPAMELVLFTNGYASRTPPFGARRVAVYDSLRAGVTEWRPLWEYGHPNPDNGDLLYDATSVTDLDHDGAPEITASFRDGTTRAWTLQVRDARTGRLITSQPGVEFAGVEDLRADGIPLVLGVENDSALRAYELRGGALRPVWTVPRVRPLARRDGQTPLREPVATRALALQLDDDPALELAVAPFDPSVQPDARAITEVQGYDFDGTTARRVGTFTASVNTTVIATQRASGLSRPFEQLVVITTDGYLQSLDRELLPTNRLVGAEFTIPGMRIGGYYSGVGTLGAAPVVGAVGSPAEPAIFVRDSRPALARLDARTASFASPPRVRWERPRAGSPLLADVNGDGRRELVVTERRDVIALDPADAARALWISPAADGPAGASFAGDILPLRRADGRTDVLYGRTTPDRAYRPTALDGRTGTIRWNSFTRTPHSDYGIFAAGDLTGDGTDDLFAPINVVVLLDGSNGNLVRENLNAAYGFSVIAPFTGAELLVYLGGAPQPDRLIDRDLRVRGTFQAGASSSPFGALARCEGAPAMVLSLLGTSEVRVIRPRDLPADGPPPPSATLARAVLAGGQRYARPEDVPASSRRNSLSHATVVTDLDGTGREGVLWGGTDGWLYALDACTLEPVWTYDFHYPVGEAVVADTTGDGVDEVLVTVGDGYLYALGPRTLPALTEVRDVAPPGDDPATDVDEVETFNTLYAAWNPVPGATRYEVRVTTASGTALRFPEYTSVTGTSARLTELPLRVGGRYRFGVIPVSERGVGTETFSDGVTIVDRAPPTLTIRAMPLDFSPQAGEIQEIAVDTVDPTGLVRTQAEVRALDGTVLHVIDDNEFRTPLPTRMVRSSWAGSNLGSTRFVPLGEYVIVATATDVGGHSASARLTVHVIAPPPDAGLTASSSGSSGCQCGARPVPSPVRGLALAVAATLAVRFGRRRRRR